MTRVRGIPPKAESNIIPKLNTGDTVTLRNGAIYRVLRGDVDAESFSVKYTGNLPEYKHFDDEPNRVFFYKDLTHAFGSLPPIVSVKRVLFSC